MCEVLAHLVEGAGEVLELARSGRVHPLLELALGQAVGGLHELVERAAHRADEHGDQRERAGEREHAGDDDQQERPAGGVARLPAGLRLTDAAWRAWSWVARARAVASGPLAAVATGS